MACSGIIVVLTFVSAGCIHLSHQLKNKSVEIDDYYWRDYKGVIPSDALSAGYNSNNETTYIAQALHKNLLVPSEINDNDKRARYEWGFKQYVATENVKIFCCNNPELFQWIKTNNVDFKKLDNKILIPGGFEPNNKIYIGRKQLENAIIVGKVQVTLPDLNAVFHYVIGDEAPFSYEFEVLAYV